MVNAHVVCATLEKWKKSGPAGRDRRRNPPPLGVSRPLIDCLRQRNIWQLQIATWVVRRTKPVPRTESLESTSGETLVLASLAIFMYIQMNRKRP